MENDEALLNQEFYKSSFKKQDVKSLPSFKLWEEAKIKEGKKVVRCPCCYGYEIFIEPTNHICSMCQKTYCQGCLKPCVEDEVLHDHEKGCCSKLCELIEIMVDWGKRSSATPKEYIITSLVFIFGNHVLYSIKYYQFFKKNKIIENDCVHSFFTYMNLIANIFYCIVFSILYFEFFFILFFPGIFIKCYLKFIVVNWEIVLEFGVDESPITELTVRGRGYPGY